jgi:arsenite-transporting ATPase
MRLDADLRRADIRPFAWIVNQSFAACATWDPVLSARAALELPFIAEVRRITDRCVVLPWTDSPADLVRRPK